MARRRLNSADLIAEARPRVIAALAARFCDLDLAEDSFAAASTALLEQADAIRNVPAWLYRVAVRKAVDQMRKKSREDAALTAAALTMDTSTITTLPDPVPDERLRLLFVCCHPALAPEARVALALKVVCGISVEAIARAFVVPVPTMYQRITRAKAKIRGSGIPFEVPHRRLWPERIASILGALEVAFALAYGEASCKGEHAEFAEDTERLAGILVELLPTDPEVLGFAAMVSLARSREGARMDASGAMIPLSQQDTTLWDRAAIMQGQVLLDRAANFQTAGPYQTLASIHLAHAMRVNGLEVNWQMIVRFYEALLIMRPGCATAINHAVALAHVAGAEEGLSALDKLDPEQLANHRPWHAARAALLERAGQAGDAAIAYRAALDTKPGSAERLYFERRIRRLDAALPDLS